MKVELVAKTLPLVEQVSPEEFSVYIARIGKVKNNPEKLLKYLLKHRHLSPLEHTYYTFKIETSLAIGRELLRHRSFTFQERSLRYEESIGFEEIELRKEHSTNRQSSSDLFEDDIEAIYYYHDWTDSTYSGYASALITSYLISTENFYKALIRAGVARECARMILPSCTTTTILMTGNIRSWLTFLDLRDHEAAQKEMQLVAKEICSQLMNEIPLTIKTWKDGNKQ